MPAGATNYYVWSQDKPCTTNQTYGYTLRGLVKPVNDDQNNGWTTKFQSSRAARLDKTLSKNKLSAAETTREPRLSAKDRLNKGYIMGYVPITKKLVKNGQSGVELVRGASAAPAYQPQEGRAKEMYLWHTLSGTLVECKHYQPPPEDD